MDNAKEKKLKDMIIRLRLELVKSRIPEGHCPYTIFIPLDGRTTNCDIGCSKCRELFMKDVEKAIRAEIEAL